MPNKHFVDFELNKFKAFQEKYHLVKKLLQEKNNQFETTYQQLVTNLAKAEFEVPLAVLQADTFAYDQPKAIYEASLYNFYQLDQHPDFKAHVALAYWLFEFEIKNQQTINQLQALEPFDFLRQMNTLGKFRSLFLSTAAKAQYIQKVALLQETNQRIAESHLPEFMQEILQAETTIGTDLADWLNEQFGQLQQVYQMKHKMNVLPPQSVPDLVAATHKLKAIEQSIAENKESLTKFNHLVNQTKALSSLVAKEQTDQRFNQFQLVDFFAAYPGLPEKTLLAYFENLAELNVFSGSFTAISGIGPKKSEMIQNALDSFKSNLYANPVFNIDLLHLTSNQLDLIKGVYLLARNQISIPLWSALAKAKENLPLNSPVTEQSLPLIWVFFAMNQKDGFTQIQKEIDDTFAKITTIQGELDWIDLTRPNDEEALAWFKGNAATFYALVERYGVIKQASAASQSLIAQEILDKIEARVIDESKLKVSLRGWQTFAVKYALVQKKVLIGDEMGLGKTVEAIGVMADLAAKGYTHFLVICPASIIINWEREIKAHSELKTFRLHGSTRNHLVKLWLKQTGVGITTYETFRKLAIDPSIELDGLIVDEAHYVKNHQAQRSIAVNQFAQVTPYVLYLTGTPIENNVEEMTGLIKILQPDLLQNVAVTDYYMDPAKYKEAIAPVYLRRKKEDVLGELPPLTQKEDWEEFGHKEKIAYEQAVRQGKFMQMRRCAWLGENPSESPKLERLLEICGEAKENGEKVIVFSFFRSVLARVSEQLSNQAVSPIIGGVSASRRQAILDAFESAAAGAVLPAQIIAGGVGLNIQAASIIVFCEPQIKPSLETQAIARAYRMGQTRPVFVHRLLTEASVDEGLMAMLDTKQKVFDEFAKDSFISDQTKAAVDTVDSFVVKNIIQQERQRMKLDVNQPIDLTEQVE